MSAICGRDAVDGYVWLYGPSLVKGGGPERVVSDEPDPDFKPRPVGFTAPLVEAEPDLWEGDQA